MNRDIQVLEDQGKRFQEKINQLLQSLTKYEDDVTVKDQSIMKFRE